MTLEDIPIGTPVFLDANIFVYHFAGKSESCSGLLEKVEQKKLQGITSSHTFAEVIHRLMILEATQREFISSGSPSQKLRKHRKQIGNLEIFHHQGKQLLALPLEIVPITPSILREGISTALQYHLLTNDALIVAAMKERNISALASADADFIGIPGVTLYQPNDLK